MPEHVQKSCFQLKKNTSVPLLSKSVLARPNERCRFSADLYFCSRKSMHQSLFNGNETALYQDFGLKTV